MKQTAVDWLVDQIENFNCMKLGLIPSDIIEEAKQMEKEQIQDAFTEGEHQQGFQVESELYYYKTYTEL
jgi:hypothetical protein